MRLILASVLRPRASGAVIGSADRSSLVSEYHRPIVLQTGRTFLLAFSSEPYNIPERTTHCYENLPLEDGTEGNNSAAAIEK